MKLLPMKLPPMWKVRREVWRIREQINAKLFARPVDRVRQAAYDLTAARRIVLHRGAEPLTDRVAILLLFQPRGIARSTLFTLDHLMREGWSVMAVSNLPLSPGDLAEVRARVALVMERPNRGYDFGGYREGMRHLARIGHLPGRLILMNDSTWFPLREDDESLRRMEESGADLVGHIYKIESTQKRGRDHIESHLLMFGRRALEHPAMQAFWRDFVMSDNREYTILRGEKGVSQAAIAAGLRVEALQGREPMHACLSALSNEDLGAVLAQVVHHRPQDRAFVEGLIAAAARGEPWREAFLAWVWKVLSNSRQHLVSVTFVEPAIRFGGLGFVKKARDLRAQLARMAVLRGIAAGRIPPLHPAVQSEIEEAVRTWSPPFDWRAKPGEIVKAEL